MRRILGVPNGFQKAFDRQAQGLRRNFHCVNRTAPANAERATCHTRVSPCLGHPEQFRSCPRTEPSDTTTIEIRASPGDRLWPGADLASVRNFPRLGDAAQILLGDVGARSGRRDCRPRSTRCSRAAAAAASPRPSSRRRRSIILSPELYGVLSRMRRISCLAVVRNDLALLMNIEPILPPLPPPENCSAALTVSSYSSAPA